MKDKIKELVKKYKFIILYGIFGVLTTVINIGVYGLLYSVLGVSNVLSNVVAWIVSVLFAFITNKLWVFESKSFDFNLLIKELGSFTACRLATGVFRFRNNVCRCRPIKRSGYCFKNRI